MPVDPHLRPGGAMAHGTRYAARGRHPRDDALSGHRRQCGDQRCGATEARSDRRPSRRRDLVEAIRTYEDGMRDYGFRAVQNSLRAMHQTVTDNVPGLLTSRLLFRTINNLPPLKRLMARRLGEE